VNLLRQLDSVHHRLTAERQLPPQLQDQHHLGSAVEQLTDVLATHSHSKTLEIVNRCPAVLQLPLSLVRHSPRKATDTCTRTPCSQWVCTVGRVGLYQDMQAGCTTMYALHNDGVRDSEVLHC
jgi:hypothetical protein